MLTMAIKWTATNRTAAKWEKMQYEKSIDEQTNAQLWDEWREMVSCQSTI